MGDYQDTNRVYNDKEIVEIISRHPYVIKCVEEGLKAIEEGRITIVDDSTFLDDLV